MYSIQNVCGGKNTKSTIYFTQDDENAGDGTVWMESQANAVIHVHNPHSIRIRPEKLVSVILNLSRGAVKKKMNKKQIEVNQQGTDLEIKLYGG